MLQPPEYIRKARDGNSKGRREVMMGQNEYENPENVRTIVKYWVYSRILGFVGLLCLFLTLITPNWIRVRTSLSVISLGLWSICVEKSCHILSGNSLILTTCRILSSMGTLCGLVAVSAALISNPRLRQSKWPLITSLATGLISLVAILLYGLSIINKMDFSEVEEERIFSYSFSFSFFGGCIGSVMFLISGLLFVMIKIKEKSMISPTSQASREQAQRTLTLRKKPQKTVVNTESSLVCAHGVM